MSTKLFLVEIQEPFHMYYMPLGIFTTKKLAEDALKEALETYEWADISWSEIFECELDQIQDLHWVENR